MKYRLGCVLFGHEWISRDWGMKYDRGGYYESPSNNCSKCGLTKEEVGIINKQKSV